MANEISRNIKNMLKKFQRIFKHIFETSICIHEIYKKIY